MNRLYYFSVIVLITLLSACASSLDRAENKEKIINSSDSWEGFNRGVFAMNDGLDRFVLKPTARAYRFITPKPINKGITNFFVTLDDIPDSANALLQGKFKKSMKAVARFLINGTIGFFGLFDVAKDLGLPDQQEDFGQTLAVWGVPSGPYIVLPLLGPSNLRDGFSLVPNLYLRPQNYPFSYRDKINGLAIYAINALDTRSGLLDLEALITGDKYIFLRDAYMQRRLNLILEGQVSDDFGDEYAEEEDDWLNDE